MTGYGLKICIGQGLKVGGPGHVSRSRVQRTNPDLKTEADLVAAASAADTVGLIDVNANTSLAKVENPTVVDNDIGEVGALVLPTPTNQPTNLSSPVSS